MENNDKQDEAMSKYAEYANHHLMERHCGTLPHPDGWVVFGNLGRSAKVNRFVELLRDEHSTDAFSWNHEEGTTFALMVIEEEEPDDLMDLWGEACGVYSRQD